MSLMSNLLLRANAPAPFWTVHIYIYVVEKVWMCLKQLEYLFYLMKYTVNYFS